MERRTKTGFGAPSGLPSYAELPISEEHPPRSSWGLWGRDDQVGTINLLDADCVLRGAACVRKGRAFSLNWALELPDPPLYGREQFRHRIDRTVPGVPILDDVLDNLFPQASSQWDALCHVGHPQYGFYNGRTNEDFTGTSETKNGIEHLARRGIVGRGVLLDVSRYLSLQGRGFAGNEKIEFTVADLEATRRAAGLEYAVGDVLLIRSGWMSWYLNADAEARAELATDPMKFPVSPGVTAAEEMAEYLWDNHVSAVASDNPAFEAWPHQLKVDEYLHFRLLGLLGISIGEMWYLEELASDCSEDGVFEFLLTSAPLNVLGGVGSPPNAIAVK